MRQTGPNFLIVGAAKAGTTSLYYWLKQHPDVFMPVEKEPSYFVHGYGFSDWMQYLSLFHTGKGKKAVGEASTAYLVAPESAELIRRKLGDVRIVILLRDPVKRAASMHSWMVMEGYEWLHLERALSEEEKRFRSTAFLHHNPEYFWDYMYFRGGLYYDQVKRYLDIWDRRAVSIHLFEDLVERPHMVFRDVCRFLDISDEFIPAFAPQNASTIPRFVGLQYFLRGVERFSVRRLGTRRVARYVLMLMDLNKRFGYPPQLKLHTKSCLRERYSANVTILADLIQRDLSHWL